MQNKQTVQSNSVLFLPLQTYPINSPLCNLYVGKHNLRKHRKVLFFKASALIGDNFKLFQNPEHRYYNPLTCNQHYSHFR